MSNSTITNLGPPTHVTTAVTKSSVTASLPMGQNMSGTILVNTNGNSGFVTGSGIGGGGGSGGGGGGVWTSGLFASNLSPGSVVTFSNAKGEIVRLNSDGTVIWNADITVDEAANSFAKALALGAEVAAGLTESVKKRMRDTVFEEIIEIAKEEGALTVDQLTFMHKSAKIMDKLKGKV